MNLLAPALLLSAMLLFGCCACDYFTFGPPVVTTPPPEATATPAPQQSATPSLNPCPESITECCIISSPGKYTLASDITNLRVFQDGEVEMPGSCIYVSRGTRDVELECASKRIIGPGTYDAIAAVLAVGAENVSVQNCGIRGFKTGIMFYESNKSRAAWNVVENASDIGVYIDNSYDSNATSNLVNNSGIGVSLSGGSGNRAERNSVYHCNAGIGLLGAPAEVVGNSVSWNGVGISTWYGSVIRDNILEGNTNQAIMATSNSTVSGNRACGTYNQSTDMFCKNCIYCVNAENVTGTNSCNVTQSCPGITCAGGC